MARVGNHQCTSSVVVAVARCAFGGLGEGGRPGVQAFSVLLGGAVGGHVGSSGLAIGGPVGGLPGACLL
jgi:hypothetical protein